MNVVDQLTEYCDCIDVEEKDVYELIGLISSYTCWMQNPCDTFLLSERREVVELPNCADNCDVYVFEPFYAPFDSESFTFTLIEQNGIEETATEITDYIYSPVDENFRLILDLPDCKCRPKCGCESKYKLLVTYVAGYELIPECLLPLFCDALAFIREKNKCCDDCAECGTDYRGDTSIDPTKLEGLIREHFLSILVVQYIRQLSLISLCNETRHLWGVVV